MSKLAKGILGALAVFLLVLFWGLGPRDSGLKSEAFAAACRARVAQQWGKVELWPDGPAGRQGVDDDGMRVWTNHAVKGLQTQTPDDVYINCYPIPEGHVTLALK